MAVLPDERVLVTEKPGRRFRDVLRARDGAIS